MNLNDTVLHISAKLAKSPFGRTLNPPELAVAEAREQKQKRELAMIAAIRAGIRGDNNKLTAAVRRCQQLGIM